jgi:hypothetical protein
MCHVSNALQDLSWQFHTSSGQRSHRNPYYSAKVRHGLIRPRGGGGGGGGRDPITVSYHLRSLTVKLSLVICWLNNFTGAVAT